MSKEQRDRCSKKLYVSFKVKKNNHIFKELQLGHIFFEKEKVFTPPE